MNLFKAQLGGALPDCSGQPEVRSVVARGTRAPFSGCLQEREKVGWFLGAVQVGKPGNNARRPNKCRRVPRVTGVAGIWQVSECPTVRVIGVAAVDRVGEVLVRNDIR